MIVISTRKTGPIGLGQLLGFNLIWESLTILIDFLFID